MPLISDIKRDVTNDLKAARKIRLPWWCLLGLPIAGFVTYSAFVNTPIVNMILPVGMSILVIGFTIVVKQNLRPYGWFWVIIMMLVALHGFLIVVVPWTSRWVPAAVVAALASADLIIMLTLVDIVARFMLRREVRRQRQ